MLWHLLHAAEFGHLTSSAVTAERNYTRSLFQRSDVLLHFQSWVMLKTTPNFALLDTLFVTIRGSVDEISLIHFDGIH